MGPGPGAVLSTGQVLQPGDRQVLSRDPLGESITNPATLHKYLYAGGDPVNRVDPSGREDLEEEPSLLSRIAGSAQRAIQKVGRSASCVLQLSEDLLLVFTIDQTAQTGIEWLIGKAFRDFRLCLARGSQSAIPGYLRRDLSVRLFGEIR